jgi:hypothetical protein
MERWWRATRGDTPEPSGDTSRQSPQLASFSLLGMLIPGPGLEESVDDHRPEEVEHSREMCSRTIRDHDIHSIRNWKEEIDTLLVFVCASRSHLRVPDVHCTFTG